MTSDHPTTKQTIAAHDASLAPNYTRHPIVMRRGRGCELWDAEGKRYLDLFAGFGGPLLGHCHPDLIEAVTDQANTLWHVGNLFHTEPQVRAAAAISRLGFGGQSFFCHSGADANEAAIKLARRYGIDKPGAGGPRHTIVTCTSSFHGRTFAAMTATGQDPVHEGFGPLPDGFKHVPFNDLDAMRAAIDETTVAVMVEPIQGEGGVIVPDEGYLPGLRSLCDDHDLLLICDEVWTGCGRTGKAFAHQLWGVTPDVMTLAKGVGGGLPVGVMCCSTRVAPLLSKAAAGKVVHASTLGGNCLSMAVTAKIFEVLERDGLIDRAAALGDRIVARLRAFGETHAFVKDVRGRGLFVGIELDPSVAGAWFEAAGDVVKRAMERGLLINATQGNTLRLAPALTVTDAELDEGLTALEAVLAG